MPKPKLKEYLRCLRAGQWVKNLFIFLPLIFGKKLFFFPLNLQVAGAFLLFSLISSTAYIFNDLIDAGQDRLHPQKRLRPVAAEKIGANAALIFACLLGSVSLAFSFILNFNFACLLCAYLVFSLLYSKWLKKIVIIDVFCIAVFFLMRILAGSMLAAVVLSHWIIFMTGLLALFLGLSKRRQELNLSRHPEELTRGVLGMYNIYFLDQMIAVVTSSVVVTYMLYAVSFRTVNEFGSQHLIYGIPFVYYGIFRYLYIVHKQDKGEDPAAVVLSDVPLQINLLLWLSACIGVIYFGI